MRVLTLLVTSLALAWVVGCGNDKNHQLPDGGSDTPPVAHIRVAPDNVSVTIIDTLPVMQDYTATLVQPDGTESDVTGQVQWSLSDPGYGTFGAATLTVNGHGAGPTRVQATLDSAFGDAGITVYVRGTRIEGTFPGDINLPMLFGAATEDPTRAPAIKYPSDGILVPPNLGQFDVHWADATVNDVWEVAMSNQYIDLRIYTQGVDPNTRIYTLFNPEEWYPIASSKLQLSLQVAGLQIAAPATKGTAPVQHVDVTNEDAKGGIYYWSTTTRGIYRYDVGTPEIPPAPYVGVDNLGACVGCHALSRDGTRIALTLDGQSGRGTVLNVADQSVLIPFDGQSQPALHWDFSSFTADANKLVTVMDGQMTLRDVNGGAALVTIPNTADDPTDGPYYATHPEVSPDNTKLVNSEGHYNNEVFQAEGGIVVRSYDDSSNTFGTPTTLVPFDQTNNHGAYYPSFSPDGQWIAYTTQHGGDGSYNNATAETWVVKADGTGAPVRLAAADLTTDDNWHTSWARWVPFAQTFGPDHTPMFYLTFSSDRQFGVRLNQGTRPQIWMTPFFPDRAAAGLDPSGPAFRVPFQGLDTANHIAQWTQAVVVVN